MNEEKENQDRNLPKDEIDQEIIKLRRNQERILRRHKMQQMQVTVMGFIIVIPVIVVVQQVMLSFLWEQSLQEKIANFTRWFNLIFGATFSEGEIRILISLCIGFIALVWGFISFIPTLEKRSNLNDKLVQSHKIEEKLRELYTIKSETLLKPRAKSQSSNIPVTNYIDNWAELLSDLKESYIQYITWFLIMIVVDIVTILGLAGGFTTITDMKDTNTTALMGSVFWSRYAIQVAATMPIMTFLLWATQFLNRKAHEAFHLYHEYRFKVSILESLEPYLEMLQKTQGLPVEIMSDYMKNINRIITQNPAQTLNHKKGDSIPLHEHLNILALLTPKDK